MKNFFKLVKPASPEIGRRVLLQTLSLVVMILVTITAIVATVGYNMS